MISSEGVGVLIVFGDLFGIPLGVFFISSELRMVYSFLAGLI
jgi:hypothetical protein